MKNARVYHKDGMLPEGEAIFVFGSNLAGIHGAGAAKVAREHFGAQRGWGVGHVGNSYAIPTKDEDLKVLPLPLIEEYVRYFIEYARREPDTKFFLTRIGCGLAGYSDEQIAPMFAGAPTNCSIPEPWRTWVK